MRCTGREMVSSTEVMAVDGSVKLANPFHFLA